MCTKYRFCVQFLLQCNASVLVMIQSNASVFCLQSNTSFSVSLHKVSFLLSVSVYKVMLLFSVSVVKVTLLFSIVS